MAALAFLVVGISLKLALFPLHAWLPNAYAFAPSLATVYGSDIASTSYEGYSDGLLAKSGVWTPEALAAFLADPDGFAAGTLMPMPEFASEEIRGTLIAFLGELKGAF